MTLATKGTRRIVVDGVAFRWSVRRRPTYAQALGWSPLTFVAEHAEEPGAVLITEMPGAHPRTPVPSAHPGNWLGLPGRPVTPATVAAGIRRALAAGWQPTRPGPPFTLRSPAPLR
jgi:hypothetical protein